MKEMIPEGKCTEGGWDWYVREIKRCLTEKSLDSTLTKAQYSSIMRMYLDRVKIEDAVLKLKGENK